MLEILKLKRKEEFERRKRRLNGSLNVFTKVVIRVMVPKTL